MVEQTILKDPSAVLDYPFDWVNHADGRWLQAEETISTYVITVATGLTKDSDSQSGGVVTVWLSGGTANISYNVACKIVTNLGRTDERSITIRMIDR